MIGSLYSRGDFHIESIVNSELSQEYAFFIRIIGPVPCNAVDIVDMYEIKIRKEAPHDSVVKCATSTIF